MSQQKRLLRASTIVALASLAAACSSDANNDATTDAAAEVSADTAVDMGESDAGSDVVESDESSDVNEAETSVDTGPAPIVDDFAVMPEPAEGHWIIEFPEQIIASGADIMTCLYLEPTTEPMWVRKATEHQGENGHHLLLFEAVVEREAGAIVDCTSEASMASLMASIFTENFAGGDLPEEYAVEIPVGTQLVVQQHYVNATLNDLRVRDAMVLETVAAETVETPLNFFALTDLTFNVPNDLAEHSTELNCTVPEDGIEVLLFGPHMHEWGTHLEIERVDVEGNVTMLHEVAEWRADYRDLPPVQKYFDDPLVLNAGETIRLSCSWINDLERDLRFPNEMCATYGYFISPSGENWICAE